MGASEILLIMIHVKGARMPLLWIGGLVSVKMGNLKNEQVDREC